MAKFDDIGTTSVTSFSQLIGDVAINTFNSLVRGAVAELMSANVNDFNKMNYDYMKIHMFRNAYEKQVTLNTLGENAYTDGNPDATATPAQSPSYTSGNNYMEFITNTREGEKRGEMVTRVQRAGEENVNKYLDMDDGENQVEFTGSTLDRNSILYKTKRLMRQNKFKTIISQFHTEGVEYNGQVGSKYGESHGRNLLTKQAEDGENGYTVNGYDNPYCRVWTHHYKYDTLEKTMRSNSGDLNFWPNFEWNDTDKGHKKDNTKYGDGEKYDYAWRGEHNQNRREVHSVLDTKTGLIKVTPQFRGGGELNRHTKDCMFSIENLAWKDYDPYSFEQALSWEQRGPLGGRIMWFPPYGLEVNETASAKWQTNEFIGRGEPVYTYVNSERTGNLTFIMLTDHPSSIDYASWWDDNTTMNGVSNTSGNSENDYLRYFAGCANGDNGPANANDEGDNGNGANNSGKTGGLTIKPTPMTDEYTRINPPLIELEKEAVPTPEPVPPEPEPKEDKNPIYVEFFVFFPNNYSGVWDKPTNQSSVVNAIAYLLGGSDTMKQDQVDIPFDVDSVGFTYENGATIGYEMSKGPVTTEYVYDLSAYIQGGKLGTKTYVPDPEKKWCYRIDHIQPYTGGNDNPKNTINQKIKKVNLKDTKTNKTNIVVNNKMASHALYKESLYSFAEVAAALYSEKLLNQPLLYKYLVDCGVDVDKVNKLIELFTNDNQKLTEILCEGAASSHGTNDRNNALSVNRANTILNWIRTNTVSGWDKLENTWDGTPKIIPVDAKDKTNINGDSAKMGRCAHCIMKFESGFTQSTTDPLYIQNLDEITIEAERPEQPGFVGFRFIKSEPQPNGQIWNYYEKDGSIKYYDQQADSQDNYDKPQTNDVVVNESQVIDIFRDWAPKKIQIIRNSPNYRGLYNERGFYIDTFNYNENDEAVIIDFDYNTSREYSKSMYVYDGGRLYVVLKYFYCDVTGKTKEEIWNEYGDNLNDVSTLMVSYDSGDYVLVNDGGEEKFYRCEVNYSEDYPAFSFKPDEWTKVTNTNIEEAILPTYKYCLKTKQEFQVNDIIMEDNGAFQVCTGVGETPYPYYNSQYWDKVPYTEFNPCEGEFIYKVGEYAVYYGDLYVCKDATYYTDDFNMQNWTKEIVYEFNPDRIEYYDTGTIVVQDDDLETYYKAKTKVYPNMCKCTWSIYLTDAIPNLVKSSDNKNGYFNGDNIYKAGDYCYYTGDSTNPNIFYYYKCNVDFYGKVPENIPFDEALEDGSWETVSDAELNRYEYSFEQSNVIKKCAEVLCFTVDAMIKKITGDANVETDMKEQYTCIWKYGTTNNLVTPEKVNTTTNLLNYAIEQQPSSASYIPGDNSIKFTKNEEDYLQLVIDKEQLATTMGELRTYIILYRILDGINKINDTEGTRNVCDSAPDSDEEMKEMTTRVDESETEGCTNVWVDRGDGMLIQECNIPKDGENDTIMARFNPKTGEGEWNKLRYDQEYHFYKQWMIDHPLMYEKLQEKIKYFNPAFHSMTPEGFNARCTFLQQCTRQGNTKTMSDSGGRTANNLAFGRPPYCVLRLGDFYNQLIVIENVAFDYNIANGIQWDLNTEGNGVQPMLCKVNIQFKFIGGGDITGPVQRLQNAMSFNYYANTSFYDNRADRVEYQPTNWKTMGGAGNDELDLDKSYAYLAKNYENLEPNVVKHE